MTIRPYQAEAIAAIEAQLATNRSTLLEMATGLGKTVVFAELANRWPGRVLVIAHRWELIRQAADKLEAATGKPVGIEMGRSNASNDLLSVKTVVASIQTMSRARRLHRYDPDDFSHLIIDEGHHATAPTYRAVLDYFTDAKKLFATATAKRADKLALRAVCESVAYQYPLEPAIADGWLVPVTQQVVRVNGLDFSKVHDVAEDFNLGELEAAMTEEKPMHEMVSSGYDIIGTRQALWFCVGVHQAKSIAEVLGRYASRERVAFLSGDTPTDERYQKVQAYKAGEIQHLCNCALFLEGFDAPATSAIVMGRPTKSLPLYMQILGRGTRPAPLEDGSGSVVDGLDTVCARQDAIRLSRKPDVLVIDYAGNAGRHKIVQATDVLGGRYTEAEIHYAQETQANEGTTKRIDDALSRAREELALLKEEADRRQKIKAEASYETEEISPFIRRVNAYSNGNTRGEPPATKPQQNYILYLSGLLQDRWTRPAVENLTKRTAGAIISKLKQRAGR